MMWFFWMTANLSFSRPELIMTNDGWAVWRSVTRANQCLLFTECVCVRERANVYHIWRTEFCCFLVDSFKEIRAASPEASIWSVIKHKRRELKKKKAISLWKHPSMKMCNINKATAFEKKTLPSWSCHPKGKSALQAILLNSQRPFCHQTPNCSLQTRDGQPPSPPMPRNRPFICRPKSPTPPPKHCRSSAGIGITH